VAQDRVVVMFQVRNNLAEGAPGRTPADVACLQHDHPAAGLCKVQRGGQAGETTADHRDIAVLWAGRHLDWGALVGLSAYRPVAAACGRLSGDASRRLCLISDAARSHYWLLRRPKRRSILVEDGDAVESASHVLDPLWRLIKDHVLAAERLHTDDTTVPILARPVSRQRERLGCGF
jgi:hypothetical protein